MSTEEFLTDLLRRVGHLETLISEIQEVKAYKKEGAPRCRISFVSPCYNEAANLKALYDRTIKACLDANLKDFEIIWVENGSTDGSFAGMRQLAENDSRLRIVRLTRNFGYQGATTCGLAQARGDFVAVLDGDLQDPPELLPSFLSLAESQGYDVVYGIRRKRKEHFFKRLAYAAFYRLWKMTAEIDIPLDAGDYCVMRRSVVRAIGDMPERQRFTRGLRAWVGFKQTGVEYERNARGGGKTKFGLSVMINLALDGLVAYSVAPLRMAIFIGISVSGAALFLIFIQSVGRLVAYATGNTYVGVLPPGISQTNLLITGIFGIQMLLFGVFGEYIGRIYAEVKARPVYLVKDRFNFDE